jgi:hypothetical protein
MPGDGGHLLNLSSAPEEAAGVLAEEVGLPGILLLQPGEVDALLSRNWAAGGASGTSASARASWACRS